MAVRLGHVQPLKRGRQVGVLLGWQCRRVRLPPAPGPDRLACAVGCGSVHDDRASRVLLAIAGLAKGKEVESPAGTVPMLPGAPAPADCDAWGKPLAACGLPVSAYGGQRSQTCMPAGRPASAREGA